jgi:uncharacterized damage-inducible protein DinB
MADRSKVLNYLATTLYYMHPMVEVSTLQRSVRMTFYGPLQLTESMRSVRGHTITIAEDIPEEHYDYRPGEGSRSVRETLLHLAALTSLDLRLHGGERLHSLQGFDFRSFMASIPIQEKSGISKAEILAALKEEEERWRLFVSQLPEDVLSEEVQTSRGTKTRFEMLLGTKEHEMHHRGQLMVIQRLLGIVPHLTRNRSAADSQAAQPAAKA